MMPIDQVIHLIESGHESEWLDFKSDYDLTDRFVVIKDILAMANSMHAGPRFIITGVKLNDDGTRYLKGITSLQLDDANLQQLVHSCIEPEVKFLYYPVRIQDTLFGVIEINDATCDRPYVVKRQVQSDKKGQSLRVGECWTRRGSENSPALRADFDRFYHEQYHVAVKLIDGNLSARETARGIGQGSAFVQITNYSRIPVTLRGELSLCEPGGRVVTRHPIFGFWERDGDEEVGADFNLYMRPNSEVTGHLLVNFESSDCLRLGMDEFGATAMPLEMRVEFSTVDGHTVVAVFPHASVHVAGERLLWKVKKRLRFR